jgi:hypothetical protein
MRSAATPVGTPCQPREERRSSTKMEPRARVDPRAVDHRALSHRSGHGWVSELRTRMQKRTQPDSILGIHAEGMPALLSYSLSLRYKLVLPLRQRFVRLE